MSVYLSFAKFVKIGLGCLKLRSKIPRFSTLRGTEHDQTCWQHGLRRKAIRDRS